MLLGPYQELIGVDIWNEVNNLDEFKQTALHSLDTPIMFSDLRMILRMFRFYALRIPFFEVRMLPWQSLLKKGNR